jgi:rubrerythrin
MIQAIIVKAIIGKIMSAIEKADDKRIASNHEKRIKKLEKDSHPRADWICMDCGCKAKKIEKPTRRK